MNFSTLMHTFNFDKSTTSLLEPSGFGTAKIRARKAGPPQFSITFFSFISCTRFPKLSSIQTTCLRGGAGERNFHDTPFSTISLTHRGPSTHRPAKNRRRPPTTESFLLKRSSVSSLCWATTKWFYPLFFLWGWKCFYITDPLTWWTHSLRLV